MPTVLITGTSRGIGLGFASHYANAGWQVHACARDVDTAALSGLAANKNVVLHALDVTDHRAIEMLGKSLPQLDLFINNAGVNGDRTGQSFGSINYDDWRQVLEVNTFAPVKLAEVLAPKMKTGGKVVMISSRMGSISDASTDSYAYRTSKTALNMVTKLLANDLQAHGITVAALHPGWVQTDMGGKGAPVSVDESVAGMMRVIDGLSAGETGTFKNYKGEVLPW
jgi:NAD(P)-dependent dehydrogenase (short-subunit alcohol dehydrogenase family)